MGFFLFSATFKLASSHVRERAYLFAVDNLDRSIVYFRHLTKFHMKWLNWYTKYLHFRGELVDNDWFINGDNATNGIRERCQSEATLIGNLIGFAVGQCLLRPVIHISFPAGLPNSSFPHHRMLLRSDELKPRYLLNIHFSHAAQVDGSARQSEPIGIGI